MTLRKDSERPRRQPPKSKWVMPVIVGSAVVVLVFVGVVLWQSGQSLF
ncbi:hypothetical protein [Marisediminicola sp. LYQ134]